MFFQVRNCEESPPYRGCERFHGDLANANHRCVVSCVFHTYTWISIGWRSYLCSHRYVHSRPFPSNRVGETRGGRGCLGSHRRDSPTIDIFLHLSIATFHSIPTFARVFPRRDPFQVSSFSDEDSPIFPLLVSVSRRGRPLPGPGGQAWRRTSRVRSTQSSPLRLGLRACCALPPVKMVRARRLERRSGRQNGRGREGKAETAEQCRREQPSFVGKRQGGQPTRRGRTKETDTCHRKRGYRCLHEVD